MRGGDVAELTDPFAVEPTETQRTSNGSWWSISTRAPWPAAPEGNTAARRGARISPADRRRDPAPYGTDHCVQALGASSGSTATVLSFDALTSRLTLDRRNSGNTAFHGKFASAESAPVKLDGGVLTLRVIIDECSVEVFAQDGRFVLSDLVFPLSGNLGTDVCVEGGTATVRKLAVASLS